MDGIDYVSHHAALGSVPRSLNDPAITNEVSIFGFLNMMFTLKDSSAAKRVVYAASSSKYGHSKYLPKLEDTIGKPLSPHTVTKYVNELYADVFGTTYDTVVIGLRYLYLFGTKQSPEADYAAVIPLFMQALIDNEFPKINGDGEQTRDFIFVDNVLHWLVENGLL
jgi:UDP-N-acetylglucosamine 4-epimerase